MRAGTLRHRVTIQAATETSNTRGATAVAWDDLATVYAQIKTTGGDERQASDQVIPVASHTVELRQPLPNALQLTPKHRLKWVAGPNLIRYFGILAIGEPDNKMRRVVVSCEELVGVDRGL